MRDRLIELLAQCDRENEVLTCFNERPRKRQTAEIIADHLLANGMIVPPCKVGQTVYYFSHRPFCLSVLPNTIYEAKVVRIVTNSMGTSLIIQIRNEYGCTEVPDIRSWGISVFATKEEAERA